MAIQMGKPAMKPQGDFEVIDLEALCEQGLFREQVFRSHMSQMDWSHYAGKEVLVKGCGNIPIPTWAYMFVAMQAGQKAKAVWYGEAAKPILVYRREG